MKATLVCLMLVGLIPVRADDRLLLARFELKDVAGESAVGAAKPSRVVALYRSALGTGPLAELVEVEATQDEQTTKHRLSAAAAGRLLDIFESTNLPDIDYQKHFDELAKTPSEARRGISWAVGTGGPREAIEIRTNDRVARFEIWSPEICFYSHPSDRIVQLVFRIVDGCSSALGAEPVFVSPPTEPNQAVEPTANAVTPAAAQPSRQQ